MNRRRQPINFFRVIILGLLVAIAIYINQVVVPTVPPPFVPTPTPTRDPETFVQEGEALFAEGKLLQAIDAYGQAIRARPNDPTLYIALARVQVFAGQYAEAQTSAEDALLLNPNNSMAHALRAWSLDFQKDYLQAEASVKEALRLDPNNPAAHAFYAEILADQYISGTGAFDTLDRAIEESRLAINLAPNSLETLRARGYILEVTQNYQEAIAQYEAAIAANPNIADLHLALGRCYFALEVYDQAVDAFIRANSLNPSDPNPDFLISRTYFKAGEYAKAAQAAEQAVKDDPGNAALHGNLGVIYYKNLLWPEAVEQLALVVNGGVTEDGIAISPVPLTNSVRVIEYYYTFGLALARLGRCGEALPVAQLIINNLPGNETAVYNAQFIQQLCEQALTQPAPAPSATP